MSIVIPPSSALAPADDSARQTRLFVVRSRASDLLANGAPVEEVRQAICPALEEQMKIALAAVEAIGATLIDHTEWSETVASEIAAFVKLTGGGWLPEQRQEFIEQAIMDLSDVPLALLMPALREVRKRVWDPKRFLVWINERVEGEVNKLETERNRLRMLREIAEG